MKRLLFGVVMTLITTLFLGSCCDNQQIYKKQFKYKIGDIVTHKVSGYKILITDTVRRYDCCGDDVVTLYYYGVNSKEEGNSYEEIELIK